ncbi:tyrosine-type recombinase/integrase [Gordonibacter sp.]|uniref:tyrosine-type recombinase/integrase n=1 Tax=Gordonibacter sp. TaxID=1968902 RepID=UPI003AA357A6
MWCRASYDLRSIRRATVRGFQRWWRPWRTERGFEGLKFHELRHTQATQLLANGVDVKTVQNRLGHSDASLTLNWYAHAVPENDKKAADLVGNLFASKPVEPRIIEVRSA